MQSGTSFPDKPPSAARGESARIPRPTMEPAAVLVTDITQSAWLSPDGELEVLANAKAGRRLSNAEAVYLCHAPATEQRLSARRPAVVFDVLELFAFVRPAEFCVPTAKGIANALGLVHSGALEDGPSLLMRSVETLLSLLANGRDSDARRTAWAMARGNWSWAPMVLSALGEAPESTADNPRAATSGLDAWNALAEWQDQAPPPPPGDAPVGQEETRQRLADLLGGSAEDRPGQADYATAVIDVFAPRREQDSPNMMMAEAGTGVGKTLGYIAPASLWSEKNEGPVWLSTYTRNLQHQIDGELDRLFPDRKRKENHVVIRKGRENYLCLLNFEDAVRGIAINPGEAVPLGLMARWITASRDGDVSGGDFPSWLVDLLGGPRRTTALSDRRGECIYTSCAHYNKCFIEKGIRKSRRADLVVANHALVMVQAARGNLDPQGRVKRFVFDEGHHVFDAADSAFSAHLSGLETAELRRWLRGHEGRSRGRARGLKSRAEDLLGGNDEAIQALESLLEGARILAGEGWQARVSEGRPNGACEHFLAAVHKVVYARAHGVDGPFGLEVGVDDPGAPLLEAARSLRKGLAGLAEPAEVLKKRLEFRLDDEADEIDTTQRVRIENICRSLQFRIIDVMRAWGDMLETLEGETPAAFVDWFAIERIDGRDIDVGLRRHWVDPTQPFAGVVAAPSHGLLVTSATLTDSSGDLEQDWRFAEERTGALHLPAPAVRTRVLSPFDYARQTRAFVVNDVRKDDLDRVAAAYRVLFEASGGGALGLFTAIGRLRGVYRRIAGDMGEAGLGLYAQHVDALNLPTLIEIFRAERDACLLGTDAVRDGVDVPGDSLRLIVFDRVPWPRPTLLHKARRQHFGGRRYDDALTRLKLRQAFGRLVRRQNDKGVFVLLDPMMPSRLLGAFPEGVEVQKVGLADTVAAIRDFLGEP